MAKPVINTTTSVLGYRQWLYWEYQPAATNSPLSWSCEGLPPGISIDTPARHAATGVASTNVVTATGSSYANGDRVFFSSITGGSGLAANTIYYVVSVSGAAFKLAATEGGAEIDFSTDISASSIGKVSTGLISGAGTTPGVWECTLTATNGDGVSDPLVFPIGIEESASFVNASMGLVFDLVSGVVSSDLIAGSARNDKGGLTPILYVKENDDYLLIVRVQKAGTFIDLSLSSLKIGLKEFEPDSVICVGGGAIESTDFKKLGSGPNAYWVLPVKFETASLKSALLDWEDDNGTQFNALAEIEFVEAAGIGGHNWAGIGPDTLRRTSRTFAINIERDLIQES